MRSSDEICAVAALNTHRSVDAAQRLPGQVFTGEWRAFLFFDSDWMREDGFVECVKPFLDADNGTCAYLHNVDLVPAETTRASLLIQRSTTREAYHTLLVGDGPADGWIYDIGRLVCASDTGEWVMYCEPADDMAMVAFRSPRFEDRYRLALSQLDAVHVDVFVKERARSHFASNAASIAWREQLVRTYGSRA